MRTHTRSTLSAALLVVVLVMAAVNGAPTLPRATPDAVGMSVERLQAATAILRQFVADRKIAGAVAAVARRGKLVYLEPVGLQSFDSKAPMTERSLFRIYSMTKAVTAVAVMMLAEERKLALTDHASKHLPEFEKVMVQDASGVLRHPSRAITVQDLLLHTSGLSHRTSELYRRLQVRSRAIALPQFVVNITKAPLLEDPGTRFRYSERKTAPSRRLRSKRCRSPRSRR
jgi:CubicO group peptidase (beta-lactamase class C family)